MNEYEFRAGELVHKKIIVVMQIMTAFFTALILGGLYSPSADIFGIPKESLVILGLFGALASVVIFILGLNEIEKKLGWKFDKPKK